MQYLYEDNWPVHQCSQLWSTGSAHADVTGSHLPSESRVTHKYHHTFVHVFHKNHTLTHPSKDELGCDITVRSGRSRQNPQGCQSRFLRTGIPSKRQKSGSVPRSCEQEQREGRALRAELSPAVSPATVQPEAALLNAEAASGAEGRGLSAGGTIQPGCSRGPNLCCRSQLSSVPRLIC